MADLVVLLCMELSGIELHYVVGEIKNIIKEYYISNVNAITKDSFLFRLHHPNKPDVMLVISTRGIWLTRLKFKQIEENDLINILKAEVERAKIESIEQRGSERIVSIKFKHMDGKSRVVIGEFFGQGNIILCDENMLILATLSPIEVRHRILRTGLPYVYPPARGNDVFDLSFEQLQYLRSTSEKDLDVLRWLGRSTSMPRRFVEEIATRVSVQSKKVGQLSDDDLNKVYTEIQELVANVSTGKNLEPIIITGADGKAQDALPIVTYNATKLPFKRVSSYMDAIDEVLSGDILDLGRNIKTVEIGKEIASLEHDLTEQNKAKEEVISKSNTIRKIASELMALSYSGAHAFDEGRVKELLAANCAYVITEKGVKFLEVVNERIRLNNNNNNLPKIASFLFGRAKEMERGSVSIEEAKSRLLAQIHKLRNQSAKIHNKVIVKHQVNKEWYERYRWFITSDGLLAIGGRDSSSNSVVIRKHLTEHDIVFHAEIYGSPFFVIKNSAATTTSPQTTASVVVGDGGDGDDDNDISMSLQQVAQATVSFSRAWKDGLFSGDAYWVKADQIRKGAPTGQFLPKGSFVIEGKRNYIKGVEIKLAIGVMQMSNNKFTLVCGPIDAVKKSSLVYSVLLPGTMDPTNIAKKIKNEFVRVASDHMELLDFIKTISIDDFVRTIPYGQSKISFTERGERREIVGIATTNDLSSSAKQSN
jgi:predicted ribosome quality control (RQC) complex YloA/Tae2 family protein